MRWHNILSRIICFVVLVFSLEGLFAVLQEVYRLTPAVRVILLFPVAKIIGDLVLLLLERSRRHSFWEDWVMEMGRFALLALVTLISMEFWKNFLGLASPPNMTIVVVIAYLLMHRERNREGRRYELS
jgi:hypothetical protein